MKEVLRLRAYDRQTNRMLDHDYLLDYSFKNICKAYGHDGLLMRFTGLCDKNGKEIYKGDVVKALKHNEFPYIEKIVWRSGSFWFGNWNWYEFLNIFRELEVIGNVFENGDLEVENA